MDTVQINKPPVSSPLVFFVTAFSLLLAHGSNASVFNWTYRGHSLLLEYSFSMDDYNYYHHKSKGEALPSYAEDNAAHPYLSRFANALRLKAQSYNWSGADERDMVIKLVQQSIPYKKDPYNGGYDYPRYPIETLVDKEGDCEDKACLLVALLKTLGYDCALLVYPTHVAAGINCPDCKGSSYKLNGRNYYYLETTDLFEIGNNPGYNKAVVTQTRQTAFATVAPLINSPQVLAQPKPDTNQQLAAQPEPRSTTFNHWAIVFTKGF
jgi:hypothetical protein